MRLRLKQRGKKAQAFGAVFEKIFETHCRQRGITATRFPDGCKQLGMGKIYRVKTPWDYILTQSGRSAFVDTKTINSTRFPYSLIQDHQIAEMYRHECEGAVAGYVIWLREHDKVIFLSSGELINLIRLRGSVTEKTPGTVEIGSVNGPGGMRISDIFKRAACHQGPESPTPA
jgi:penicillin-binding protein-related factor A (putative recombinase)